jgi:hypothetical protein
MKRRIDPLILTYIKDIIRDLPRLTEEEALQLVPMLRSQDEEIRDCAAEILYQTNWIDMELSIAAFQTCNVVRPARLDEIFNMLQAMSYNINDYDSKLAQIIYDENSRLFKADQIISSTLQ